MLGGGEVWDLGTGRDGGVQIQMGGSDVIPVDDDEEDHEGRAEDDKDAKHPGCSHGDCCWLQGHHGNRFKVQELLLSSRIDGSYSRAFGRKELVMMSAHGRSVIGLPWINSHLCSMLGSSLQTDTWHRGKPTFMYPHFPHSLISNSISKNLIMCSPR